MNIYIGLMDRFLDLLIVTVYLKGLFIEKSELSRFYYPIIVCDEFVFLVVYGFIRRYNADSYYVIATMLSIVSVYALTFFFKTGIGMRIFTMISYPLFFIISIQITHFIIKKVNPVFFDLSDTFLSDIITLSIEKVFLFLFIILLLMFCKRQSENPVEYDIVIVVTPLISLAVLVAISMQNLSGSDSEMLYTVIIISCIVMNILVYILIKRGCAAVNVQNENTALIKQISFQSEKYELLSESYKQSRRIIHDIKKHCFVLNEYALKSGNTDISEYISELMTGLESAYIKYNTGNLVIDSMITNYENIAIKSDISFTVQLHVNNKRIPVMDYDLSIILGNLLDNAINATRNVQGMYIKLLINTEDDKFLIIIENSNMSEQSVNPTGISHGYDHGYGLSNIEKTVKKYYGIMSCEHGNPWIVKIVIPIFESPV